MKLARRVRREVLWLSKIRKTRPLLLAIMGSVGSRSPMTKVDEVVTPVSL